MPMKRLTLALLLLFALTFATSAWAGTSTYADRYWFNGDAAGSSFSSSWWQNGFGKRSGYIGTVLFIDNVSYGWHVTVRNDSEFTATHWFSSQVKKGHCRANSNAFYGACTVFN
jgi:hypothetical protein